MKIKSISSLCMLALALALSGCGQKTETPAASSSGGANKPAKRLKLAFVVNNAATFWTIARAGTEDAAKELGKDRKSTRLNSSHT